MQFPTRLTLAATLAFAVAPCLAMAQGDKSATQSSTTTADVNTSKPEPQPYSLIIAVKESSSGKLVLEKSYNLPVIADNRSRFSNLRDSDRIPYQGEKGPDYQDVGTNIDVNEVSPRRDGLAVTLRVTSSALVPMPNFNAGNLPRISTWGVSVSTVLSIGKTAIIYTNIDAVSGHKVEIQATAQPLN